MDLARRHSDGNRVDDGCVLEDRQESGGETGSFIEGKEKRLQKDTVCLKKQFKTRECRSRLVYESISSTTLYLFPFSSERETIFTITVSLL